MSPRRDPRRVARAFPRPRVGGDRAIRGSNGGFTIIELIVVLAVIATLAAIVAPALFRHVAGAREQAARQDLAMIDLALRSYRLDNGALPTAEQGLEALRERPSIEPVPWRWKGPYLRHPLPRDPWGHAYAYRPGTVAQPFDVRSLGRDGAEGGEGEDADLKLIADSSAIRADSLHRDSVQP